MCGDAVAMTRCRESRSLIGRCRSCTEPRFEAREMPSLEDNFVFYGSYHNNGVNQAAHVVCVPLIFITSLIMLAGIPICDCDCGIPCNAALLAAVAYGLFYISLRVGLGVSMDKLTLTLHALTSCRLWRLRL